MTKEEHKAIFIETIFNACKDEKYAKVEYEAMEKYYDDVGDYSDPEGDAEECMSYWTE